MKLVEIRRRCEEWNKNHKGTSPISSSQINAIENMVEQGKVTKELVAVYDNGIHVYAYADLQGRTVISPSGNGQPRDNRECAMNEIADRGETPQERYHKKVGLVSKTYKINKEIVEAFTISCEIAKITQSKQLSILMQEFIDKNK